MFQKLHNEVQLYLSCDDSIEIDKLNNEISNAYSTKSISIEEYNYLVRLVG